MIIYTIKNTLNGRQLIGQTMSAIKKRWNLHKYYARRGKHQNPHFQRAWNKYGEDVFVCESIDSAVTLDQLNELEEHYIAVTPNTYNILAGGRNKKHTPETKLKMSLTRKGKKRSPETCRRISEGRLGMKFSKEHCRNMGKTKIGNKNRLGKMHSLETRRKISKSLEGNQNAKR
jgi:group I intron endonuclease